MLMVGQQLLCRKRLVEGNAFGVIARAGVIAPDNEVRCAVVLADDCMPERFTGTGHAHG
jgi:hypothetical protein